MEKIEKLIPMKMLTNSHDLYAKVNEIIDVVNILLSRKDGLEELKADLIEHINKIEEERA